MILPMNQVFLHLLLTISDYQLSTLKDYYKTMSCSKPAVLIYSYRNLAKFLNFSIQVFSY